MATAAGSPTCLYVAALGRMWADTGSPLTETGAGGWPARSALDRVRRMVMRAVCAVAIAKDVGEACAGMADTAHTIDARAPLDTTQLVRHLSERTGAIGGRRAMVAAYAALVVETPGAEPSADRDVEQLPRGFEMVEMVLHVERLLLFAAAVARVTGRRDPARFVGMARRIGDHLAATTFAARARLARSTAELAELAEGVRTTRSDERPIVRALAPPGRAPAAHPLLSHAPPAWWASAAA